MGLGKGAVPGWRPGQRPPERNDPPVTLGQGHMSHTFHEAQSKRWSPPKALEGARAHTHTPPLDGPLTLPRSGLRQCSAAIFRPHAALQPHPPSGVNPAGAAAPQSCRVGAWSGGSSSMSPGRTASQHQPWPKTPNQPRQPQRGPLTLEKDSVFRPQAVQGSLRLPPAPPHAWACAGTWDRRTGKGSG